MQYLSTRDSSLRVSAAEAIVMGLSRDGGLFLPESIPALTAADLQYLAGCDYPHRAAWVMGQYLDSFTPDELLDYARKAYGPEKFDTPAAAPVVTVGGKHILELWHGPTCAFKDMALQMLPYLLTASLKKTGEHKTVCILVATSGDTGKAALEGFRDVPQSKILVFYPEHGVSEVQKLQMVTQEGGNVAVCAVEGNFDDAQNGVKRIFSDEAMRRTLAGQGKILSSANSINWGRVLPQLVYYISAYCDLLSAGKIVPGEQINICVPTGNFGNILAAYYTKRMGLPVNRLICASNANNVLTDFLRTGVYDRNRPFHTTTSPSMDILISSNLERLLYLLCGSDAEVRGYMDALKQTGRYEVSPAIFRALGEIFDAGFCLDGQSSRAIGTLFDQTGYLMDPHTAVGYAVLEDYRRRTGDAAPTVLASTASPFKFCHSVLQALGVNELRSGVEQIDQLSQVSGKAAPLPLLRLKDKAVRFTRVTDKQDMERAVLEML